MADPLDPLTERIIMNFNLPILVRHGLKRLANGYPVPGEPAPSSRTDWPPSPQRTICPFSVVSVASVV